VNYVIASPKGVAIPRFYEKDEIATSLSLLATTSSDCFASLAMTRGTYFTEYLPGMKT